MDPLFLGLRHVALNVRDIQKSLEFYSTVMGMKLEWMPDAENAYLTSGHDNLALHKLPEGSSLGGTQTIHHIGFVVRNPDEVDRWAERLRKAGVTLAAEP